MKFLHTSDWHLGIALHGLSMQEEQEHFLDQLCRIAEEEAVDAVLIAGDIYDSSVASHAAIRLYHRTMDELCLRQKRPVFVIAGNHDGAVRLAAMQALVRPSGLYVSGTLENVLTPVLLGDAAVYQIPYFQLSNVRAVFPALAVEHIEQAMEAICDKIREHMDRNRINIVMAHTFAGGAVLSESDRSALVGGVSVVADDVFRGFDYVALGHLHRPQNVGDRVRYSGSPIAYSFGEAGQQKSVTLFDSETGEISVRKIQPLHAMRVIKGSYAEVMNDGMCSSDYMKIAFTDRSAEREAMEKLKERYPNLLLVTGKAPQAGRETSLSPEAIEKLSPEKMLDCFLADIFGETADMKQKKQWLNALQKAEEGL